MLIFDDFLDFLKTANENNVMNYLLDRGSYRVFIIENIINAIRSRSIRVKCERKRFTHYRINRISANKLCVISGERIYMSNSTFNDMEKGTFVPNM